jgi:hypothetical protein
MNHQMLTEGYNMSERFVVANSKTLTCPSVNINGTSAKELQDQLMAAWRAGKVFQQMLAQAMPHGRDYQTVSQDAYRRARDEHLVRISHVEAICEELQAIAVDILDQTQS